MDPTALFQHGANELNRLMHLAVFCGAGVAAVIAAGYALRFWLRARRQRHWEQRLANVKRELAELELQQITTGYHVPPKGRQAVN